MKIVDNPMIAQVQEDVNELYGMPSNYEYDMESGSRWCTPPQPPNSGGSSLCSPRIGG